MKAYKNKRYPIKYKIEELPKNELEIIHTALLDRYNKLYKKQKEREKEGKRTAFSYQVTIGNIDAMLTELDKFL